MTIWVVTTVFVWFFGDRKRFFRWRRVVCSLNIYIYFILFIHFIYYLFIFSVQICLQWCVRIERYLLPHIIGNYISTIFYTLSSVVSVCKMTSDFTLHTRVTILLSTNVDIVNIILRTLVKPRFWGIGCIASDIQLI